MSDKKDGTSHWDEAQHGTFHWNELMTGDVDKAKAFFTEVIGWSFEGMPMEPDGGTYWLAMQNGNPVAGMMDMTGIVPDGVPPHWMGYLAVDDVDARVKKVTDSGGTIIKEAFEVPGVGKIAIVTDATGAALGLITPAGKAA